MADKSKQPPVPPPAPTPPAAAEPVVSHDKSAIDDFAKPYVQMFIAHAMRFFADHRAVDRLMRDLGPVGKAGVGALPGAVALAVRKMPDSWFKNPELAHFIRDIIRDGARDLAEILKTKGVGASAEDIEKTVSGAEQAAMDRMLVVDPMGHVHVDTCARLSVFRRPVNQNQRNQNQQQPQPSPANLPEIKLKDAIAQGLKASPCCTVLVQEAIDKSASAPKSRKNLSPLEVVGSIKDEELKKSFKDWLNGLTKQKRIRALDALRELDSVEEFYGFMAMEPAIRMEMLPLLENRNATHAVQKYLGIMGSFIKNGWHLAADHYSKWNDSLAPEVERLMRRYHDEDGNVKPYQKPGWVQSLKAIFSLNPFN